MNKVYSIRGCEDKYSNIYHKKTKLPKSINNKYYCNGM